MGLGKTPQGAAACAEGQNQYTDNRRALVFCPTSIKTQWRDEMMTWGAYERNEIFIAESRADVIPLSAQCVILNYELVETQEKKIREPETKKVIGSKKIKNRLVEQISKIWFRYGVMDEIQRLKNLKSKRTNRILGHHKNPLIARCFYKWGFTGTWMPNRPIELYPALKALAPEVMAPHTGWNEFGMHYCDGYVEDFGGYNFTGASHIEELREKLKGFMLRRTIDEVYDQIPKTIVTNIFFDIGEMDESDADTPLATLRKMIGDKKLPFAVQYIRDWLDNNEGEQLVLFAFTQSVVEGLQAAFPNEACHIYGKTGAALRRVNKELFIERKARVIILQINAAGEGLDGLQNVCNNAILVELDWSSGLEDQLIGRLRRIGQKEVVRYTRLIAEGTLDDPMFGTLKAKRKVSQALFGKQKGEEMAIEKLIEDGFKELAFLLKTQNALLEKIMDPDRVVVMPNEPKLKAEKKEVVPGPNGELASGYVPKEATAGRPGKPKKEEPAKSKTMLEDLQKVLRDHIAWTVGKGMPEKNAQNEIKEQFGLHGVTSIKNLPQDRYDAVIEAIAALQADTGEEGEDDGLGDLGID